MPISHKHKLIFIHIPKTAGTSIQETFSMEDSGHYTCKELKKKYPKEWDIYTKFAVIRNPWDRLVSNYYYILSDKNFWFDNVNNSITPFKLNNGQIVPDRPKHELFDLVKSVGNFENWTKVLSHSPHIYSKMNRGYDEQHPYIYDNDKLTVDYLLRYENLEEDFNNMFHKLNIPITKLLKLNVTNKCDNYRELHTNVTKHLTEKLYNKDIKLFNYNF